MEKKESDIYKKKELFFHKLFTSKNIEARDFKTVIF